MNRRQPGGTREQYGEPVLTEAILLPSLRQERSRLTFLTASYSKIITTAQSTSTSKHKTHLEGAFLRIYQVTVKWRVLTKAVEHFRLP